MDVYGSFLETEGDGEEAIPSEPTIEEGSPPANELPSEPATEVLKSRVGSDLKSDFSVLSTYQWGSYAGADALLTGDIVKEDTEDEEQVEVECYLEGEDNIVLLTDSLPHLAQTPPDDKPSIAGSVGEGIFSFANDSLKKVGNVIYYAANSVGESSNKIMLEAKATLSKSSNLAVITVAGGAAAETLHFTVDRSRLMGQHMVTSLQGDPEASRLDMYIRLKWWI